MRTLAQVLATIATVLMMITLPVALYMLWRGIRLQFQYTKPYTLKAASTKQKWQWAFNLACLQILPLLLPLLLLVISALFAPQLIELGQQSRYFFYCVAPVIVAFPLAILWKWLELEHALNTYLWQNRLRKNSIYQTVFKNLKSSIVLSKEDKRFLTEGYPDTQTTELRERFAYYSVWISFLFVPLLVGIVLLGVILNKIFGWWR